MHPLKGSIAFFALITISIIFFGASSTSVSTPEIEIGPDPYENTAVADGTLYSKYMRSENCLSNDDGHDEGEDQDGYDNEGIENTEPDDMYCIEHHKIHHPPIVCAPDEVPRVFLAQKVGCHHYVAGHNVNGAVDEFLHWATHHTLHTKSWHWAVADKTAEGQAILWQCNCRCYINQPIYRYELEEAIKLIHEICGPGQAGRVYLDGYREIGVGSMAVLAEKQKKKGRHRSMCYLRGCCYNHPTQMAID